MTDRIQELQSNYIAEMRTLQKELIPWWLKLAGIDELGNEVPNRVNTRWPFGYSGHPRVVAVFRKYFLEIERHNDDLLFESRARIQAKPDLDRGWGDEGDAESVGLRRPVDILIGDIEDLAPDINKLVAGIVFVPVGLNQYNESV
jgi:hypothetical protein